MYNGMGLGQDGPLASQWDGILGGRPGSAGDGLLSSYKDGVLGRLGLRGCMGCGMGEYFSPTKGTRGVGEYFNPMKGARGVGEYFNPMKGLGEYFGVRGLGDSSTTTVDMRKPAVLREVKMAMYAIYAGMPGAQTAAYGEAWLSSGTWEQDTTAMWFQVAQQLASETSTSSEQFITSVDVAGQTAMYPSPTGLQALMLKVGTTYFSAPDSPPMEQTYPVLAFAAVTPATVMAPYFDRQEKMRANVVTMAKWGIGAAAVIGIAMALKKKR